MKNIYLMLLIFVSLVSCNTQRQQTNTDSIPEDSVTYNSGENINKSASQYCGNLVIEVLKSSARFRELSAQLSEAIKKNGGEIGVVLDKSPFPKVDKAMSYSENYEMQVTENYPDRQVNIAHFNFDPHKKQLYEYNVIRDQFITVEFNKSLLDNAGEYCK